jgi:hypothetical protein
MDLTDYSIHSRMRRADFLILAKEYKALEEDANKMIELDKVNPRIYRYLGYAAYENGNVDKAIQSLETFTSNPANKIIAKDFQVLGFSKIKKGTSADGLSIDPVAFEAGLASIRKSLEMDSLAVEDLNEYAHKLYSQKLYKEAAAIFELGNTYDDYTYLGLSIYSANTKKGILVDKSSLLKADIALDKSLVISPSTSDLYFYKGRINSLIENDVNTIKNYESYVAAITAKGAEEVAKPAVIKKIAESYNTIGAIYANTDKVKAIEYFNKTLAIDPTNAYALSSIKQLK